MVVEVLRRKAPRVGSVATQGWGAYQPPKPEVVAPRPGPRPPRRRELVQELVRKWRRRCRSRWRRKSDAMVRMVSHWGEECATQFLVPVVLGASRCGPGAPTDLRSSAVSLACRKDQNRCRW